MIKLVRKSSSGSTKEVDLIFLEINNPKSLAAAILLRKQLLEQDIDFMSKMDLINKRINFSREYLEGVLNEKGTIKCTYCPKQDLIIEYDDMKVDNNVKATIDHIVPISKGGGVFDVKNITPCCGTCNTKKGNKTLEEFLKFK
jgi:5-methylcytosine-specific restriction endonuclease McrA